MPTPADPALSPGHGKRRVPWPLVAVWLGVLVVFLPALRGDYVDDDLDLLGVSPTFAGIDHLWDAIRAPFWGLDLGYWRPLTSAVMCAGHALGGGHPWPTHAVALLVHLLATTLAFATLRLLGVEVGRAALAAGLFALHPCQVESVAWVAALGDPLTGCLTLFALWAWVRWRLRGGAGLPWAAWIGFALALASKESGVVALGWLAAAEVVCRRRSPLAAARLAAAAIGFAAVLALWFALRVAVFGDVRAGFDRGRLDLGVDAVHGAVLRLYLAAGSVTVPTGWLGFTPYRWIPPDVAGLVQGLWPSLLVAGLGIACVFSAARARRDIVWLGALGLGAAVAPAALLPASLGPWPLVDRYLYTALFGCAAVLLGSPRCRTSLALVLVGMSALASALLVPQWRTHAAVVERALADCPRHPEPHYLAANLERTRAERLPASPKNQAAWLAHLRRALAGYGRASDRLSQPLYAAGHLREVVGLNAELGAAVVAITGNLRPLDTVAAELEDLVARRPNSVQVQLVWGMACVTRGDAARAEVAWRRALAIDPTSREAAHNLTRLLQSQGQKAEATGR